MTPYPSTACWRRFPASRYKTSARNQWFGTITGRDHQQVQQHVDVLLADGQTRFKVAITAQSADRLGLTEGQEVLVLLKAPWVGITLDHAVAQQADNQLTGHISHIERGPERCEVIMALPDGQKPVRHAVNGANRRFAGRRAGDRLLQCRSHHSGNLMLMALTLLP